MSREEIRSALAAILADVTGIDPSDITEEKLLSGDLDLDSLSMVEIIVVIDEKLGVRIEDESVADLRTVGDVVSSIEALRKASV